MNLFIFKKAVNININITFKFNIFISNFIAIIVFKSINIKSFKDSGLYIFN